MASKWNLARRAKLAWMAFNDPGLFLRKALTVTGKLSTSGTIDVDPTDVATLSEEGYEKHEVVYACVRTIATSAADVPIKVAVGDAEDSDHPLAQLLATPWPWLSGYELLEATLTYLSIAGKSFWWKRRSNAGRVVGLYPLRPDLMRIETNGGTLDNPIRYFEYTWDGSVYQFPVEDVIYHRYFRPMTDVGALPPLAVGMDAVDADNMATKLLQYFFRQGAMLKGVLSTEARLDKDQRDFLQESFAQQYSGMENSGKVAVLSNGAKYQPISASLEDMAFPELRKMSESRICMVFGVPPIVIQAQVGLQAATYSNFQEAQKVLWRNTLSPIYGRVADKGNADLAHEFGDDVSMAFAIDEVPAMQESRDASFARANTGYNSGWLMRNEARAEAGLPPTTDGDVFKTTLAEIQQPGQLAKAFFIPGGWGQATGDLTPTISPVPPVASPHPLGKAAMAEEAKERHAKQRDLIARAWEGRFTDQARELFDEEAGALKALVQDRFAKARKQSGGDPEVAWVEVMFAVKELVEARGENWRDGFIPLFKALLGAQGETIAADFGIDFNLDNPQVQDWIAGYTFKFAQKITEVSIADLGGLVGQAQDEGWSIPRLQDALGELYDGWSATRSEMVARTETIRSSNAGAQMSYEAAGIEYKEWWTTEDNRRCPFCKEMHGTVIAIGDVYWQQGSVMEVTDEDGKPRKLNLNYEDVNHPPLHPFCRCSLTPVV